MSFFFLLFSVRAGLRARAYKKGVENEIKKRKIINNINMVRTATHLVREPS